MDRRIFNKTAAWAALGTIAGCKSNQHESLTEGKPTALSSDRYKLSLAQWSLHKSLQNGTMSNVQFISKAAEMGFKGVEYVSSFLANGLKDNSYWSELNKVAEDAEIEQLLIMTDLNGSLGASQSAQRQIAIEEHIPWLEAAQSLNCNSIRVNLWGEGSKEDQALQCIDSMVKLCQIAMDYNLNVIVENHGGYSSDGKWLSSVVSSVDMDNCGTLPDFGNFCIQRENGARWGSPCNLYYDKYKGVKELMPHAKAVSAKSYGFDRRGYETKIDYYKMMTIVNDSGYKGYIGVEFEGEGISEIAGIKATKALLEKVIAELPE